ncbi:Protein kinase [Aphelenchoides avenae]|nr:Protein kinase [Aphelenchus avenae]
MSQAKAPTLFKCVQCGKEYNKVSSFRVHMWAHREKLHECDQCEKKYKRREALLEHKHIEHTADGHFECDECERKYTRRRTLLEHKRIAHAEVGKFECEQCGKKYTWRGSLREHKQAAHAKAGRFTCDQCGKICPHKQALRTHKQVHSERTFECLVCGKTMPQRSSYRHMKTHTGQPCECDVCGSIHPNPRSLARHKRSAHSEAKHRCEHCGKVFSWASDLRKHMTIHDDSRFTCDSECGLQSATRSEYLEHLRRRHVAQHPATCKCAPVDVKRAQQVATNMGQTAFVEADGTMKCIDGCCDFETTCARQMESHKEQCHHDSYQPVLHCRSCKTWFTSPWALRSHNAVKHQGERRFKCDDCGYVTNNQFGFTKHQTSCQQGRALGNIRLKIAEPTTENLDIKQEPPRDVYQFGPKLGEGGFGKVYEAVKTGEYTPVKYAIKEVGPKGGKSAELEAKRMRQFEHKNLMALLEYYEWKEEGRLSRFIVMECCRPGSLTTMQKLIQFQFEEHHVLYVLKEVACGLEHLHGAGVIHRDLKSANVLVNEGAVVKIADFGVSTDERIAFNCRGTPGWEAPEVVAAALTGITGLKSAYTQKADVYSVGVLAIDCFLPRETLPTDFFHKKKVESESFAETQLQRIEDDRHLQLSKAFKDLVTGCLAPMTTRLSAAAVQKVPDVKKSSIEPFKLLVAECLRKQKKKEEKRSTRRRKPTIDTEPTYFYRRSPPAAVDVLRTVQSLLGPCRAQSASADVYEHVEPLLQDSG